MSMKLADRYFAQYIRQRDIYCQNCGRSDSLQCAHIYSRSYKAIRCDERNAIALCKGCHLRFTHRPIEWDRYVRLKFGDALIDELRDIALRYERQDWKALAEHYRGLL